MIKWNGVKDETIGSGTSRNKKKHYSIRTEQAYTNWIKKFILFNGKRHPKDMGEKEISQYISYLVVKRNVAASTQNQALNAVVFLYKQILNRDLGDFGNIQTRHGG